MLVPLLALAVVLVLIVVYVVLQSGKKTRDQGDTKLINRKIPPNDQEGPKAGAADYE
ncbi:hypothetical protein ACWKWU_19180 [Chitinophaga lutea]